MSSKIQSEIAKELFENKEYAEFISYINTEDVEVFKLNIGAKPDWNEPDNRYKIHIYDVYNKKLIYYDGVDVCHYELVEDIDYDMFMDMSLDVILEYVNWEADETDNEFYEIFHIEHNTVGFVYPSETFVEDIYKHSKFE